jgi:hypothetical protein
MPPKEHIRGKRYTPAVRDKVFRIWLHNDQNLQLTSRIATEKLKMKIQAPTIMRWRDQFDWEARAAVYNNELSRMMRMSDDPVLKTLAMDDVDMARVLTQIQHIVRDVLRQPKRYGVMPKNISDLVKLMQFSRDERERILKRGAAAAVPALPGGGINYYDQRKQELKVGFDQLPPEAQRDLIGQVSKTLGQASKSVERAREEAFGEDDEQ